MVRSSDPLTNISVPEFRGETSAGGVATVDEAGVPFYLFDTFVLLEVPNGDGLVGRGSVDSRGVLRKLQV